MNPISHAAGVQPEQFSSAVVWLNWLVLLPMLAAGVAAAYPRFRVSAHWPAAACHLAVWVAVVSAVTAAALLAFTPDAAWPLTADYRWTGYLFQFRLRLDRFNSVLLLLLCWQFAILALGSRPDARAASQNGIARRHAREASATMLAFGCCTGALLAADLVAFLMFWMALALPVAALLVFAQPEGREAGRPIIVHLLLHALGSLAMLACFAFTWAQTGTTDPFAAGMSLLLRDVAALRWAAVLLVVGFGCTICASALLATRPAFLALCAVLMTTAAGLLMRYLHLLFWPYALEPIAVVVLWLCAIAACGFVGAGLALRTGHFALAMLVCAAACYVLFAVAGSAAAERGAHAALAYLLGLGVSLPLLAPAAGLLRFEARRPGREPGRGSALSRTLGLAAVFSLASAPGTPAFGGGLLLARSLARPQLAPLVVAMASVAGLLVCAFQMVHRVRWLPPSEIGWSDRTAVLTIAAVAAAGVLAWLWVPPIAHAAAHLKGVGGWR